MIREHQQQKTQLQQQVPSNAMQLQLQKANKIGIVIPKKGTSVQKNSLQNT